MLTAVDLFCGAGGMTLGLSMAGFHVVGAMDAWGPAVRTYSSNFNHPIVSADVRNMSVDEFRSRIGLRSGGVDLVVGGPPCQGFSIQRIGDDKDERNDLIFEFARFILELRPRMFLMENVTGLIGSRGRPFASRFQEMMEEAAYVVETHVVNAAEYGVPQSRRRVFFYGWLKDVVPPFRFPRPDHRPDRYRTVIDAIKDLPPPPPDYTAPPYDPLHRRMRMSAINAERLRHIPPGGGMEHLPVELRVNAHKNGAHKIGHRYVYGRLAPNEPAGTITARFDSFTRGKFAHPFEDRNITLREGARLQTFPDDFKFEGSQEEIAALIGNAVPPLLAKKIGRAIARHLNGEPAPPDLLGPLFMPRDEPGLSVASEDKMPSKRPAAKSKLTVWKTSLRQTYRVLPRQAPDWPTSANLRVFLESDGMTEDEILSRLPYDRSRAGAAAGGRPDPKRYRDARQVYRAVGLLYEEEEDDAGVRRLRVTELGRRVLAWLETLNDRNHDVLGRYLANALAACQLRNPTEEGQEYDESVRVFPFAFIWRAMLSLDGKINSDELARAIFKVTDEESLNEAIKAIAEAREKGDPNLMGTPVETVNDRIIPWMAMASFGWTLFRDKERDGENRGFYVIPDKTKEVLRAAAGVRHKHLEFDPGDAHAIKKYVERISAAASLPKDIR